MSGPLYVNFMWHMHQPYYRDPATKKSSLPWVRLHATKDYLDMALLLEEYPKVKSTFNFVPSLLKQVEEYTVEGLSDDFLDLARKPAASLNEEEKLQILKKFFMANRDRMVSYYARYRELLVLRESAHNDRELKDLAASMTAQDFLDLQVWFNLAWYDPYLAEKDPSLKALRQKGAGFDESDKALLLEKQMEAMKALVPSLKKMADSGQIEISTTPFYHPILPLLCDTDTAKICQPGDPLPARRFAHPEDARAQLSKAVKFYKERFGAAPKGMWPSEGSVSDQALGLIAGEGLKWAATDEEILFRSMPAGSQANWRSAEVLYRGWAFRREGRQLNMLFRDHSLSDRIGFVYYHWDASDAAGDLVNQLLNIQAGNSSAEAPLVSIILDGENAWEYYHQDGLYFLRSLYERLSNEPRLEAITPSQYFERHPPTAELNSIHPGSWINHNFRIWLGHAEDNLSWDFLGATRDALVKWQKDHVGPEFETKASAAWESIYMAEGSDWNWWYGDDHHSDLDEEFDRLYRLHLSNVYETLGLEVPDKLHTPICRAKAPEGVEMPVWFIHPVIDGEETHYYEWQSAGFLDTTKSGGAMHQAENLVRALWFGYDQDHFYLRMDLNKAFSEDQFPDLKKLAFKLKFISPAPRVLSVSFAKGAGQLETGLEDENGAALSSSGVQAAAAKVFELSLPFENISCAKGAEVQFLVFLMMDGEEVEHWPVSVPVTFKVPGADFEADLWSA